MRIIFRTLAGVICLSFLLAATSASAVWRRAESANFIVYGTVSEASLRERVRLLENYRLVLRTVTNARRSTGAPKLSVYILNEQRDLRILRPVEQSVAGFYSATAGGIAAFVSPTRLGDDILLHEYTHHFMMQYAPGAYPPWYVEGFAEYFMTAQVRSDHFEIGRPSTDRERSLALGDWVPMPEILFYEGGGIDGDAFYAQSWLATHYFFSTPERQAALRRYLAAIGRGEDPREAFEPAVGMTADRFNAALRAYARSSIPYQRVSHAVPPDPEITVTTMPRSADDLILYEAALRLGVPEAYRERHLRQVRDAAARHRDDAYARRVLAHIEVLHGDAAAADLLLEGLLAEMPNDAELMYLKGMRYFTAAQAEESDTEARAQLTLARQWFGRAHRADGNHFPTLYRFVQSQKGEPEYVSENNLNALTLAHELAPQVSEIRLATAAMLMHRGQFTDAEAVLGPLAANIHISAARNARELLELARRREIPGEDAEETASGGAGPDEEETPVRFP